MSLTSTRIRPGLYEVTKGDRTYVIEDRPDVDPVNPVWRLSDESGTGEWLGDFLTKRAALAYLTFAL